MQKRFWVSWLVCMYIIIMKVTYCGLPTHTKQVLATLCSLTPPLNNKCINIWHSVKDNLCRPAKGRLYFEVVKWPFVLPACLPASFLSMTHIWFTVGSTCAGQNKANSCQEIIQEFPSSSQASQCCAVHHTVGSTVSTNYCTELI